jgi:hypothetical protein
LLVRYDRGQKAEWSGSRSHARTIAPVGEAERETTRSA